MSSFEKRLLLINAVLYLFLAVFSYAYVDLNLTLSRSPIILRFVGLLQRLGYYNRPLSTLIFLIFLICSFSFFAYNLWLFYRLKVGLSYLIASTVLNTFVLIFAYPFLSSDLFNYLFDARIILKYHANPYTHRPLDFGGDDWLRFMRWIHRYSPYGPLWLLISLVPSFSGFGKFLLTFFTFKIFIGLFHLINSFLIFKSLKKINPEHALIGTSFYALNPLFLIEGVANAHNDIVLATFLLASIYFFVSEKKIYSYISVLLGILIKYITVLTLPWFVYFTFFKNCKNFRNLLITIFLTMILFTFIFSSFKITVPFVSSGSTQVQFQPWYLFWSLPLLSVLALPSLMILAIALAFGSFLRYFPYLFYGDWSHPSTLIFMQVVVMLPLIIVGFFISLKFLISNK